jgi:hypothetical protein
MPRFRPNFALHVTVIRVVCAIAARECGCRQDLQLMRRQRDARIVAGA